MIHQDRHEQYHLHHTILCFCIIPAMSSWSVYPRYLILYLIALLYRASVRMYSHLALMDTFELRPTSRSRWSLWLDGLAAVALLPVSELWVLCCIQLLVLGVAQCPFRILIDLHLHPLSRSLPSVRFIVVLCCSQWLHLAIPEHGYHFLNPRSFCLMALLTYL